MLKRILIVVVILAAIPTTTFAARAPSCDNGGEVEYSRSADEGPMRPGEHSWFGTSGASYYKCPNEQPHELYIAIAIFGVSAVVTLVTILIMKSWRK